MVVPERGQPTTKIGRSFAAAPLISASASLRRFPRRFPRRVRTANGISMILLVLYDKPDTFG
jgi:hypothetical protein